MEEDTGVVSEDSEALPSLGPLERQVLALLWEQEELTVRDARAELATRGVDLAYTTVMTVMVRLFEKGLLSRTGRGKQFVYRAQVDEESFRRRSAHALAESLVQGYGRLAIATFVEELAKVSPERLKELGALANRAAKGK